MMDMKPFSAEDVIVTYGILGKCCTPHITVEDIQSRFLMVFNELNDNRKELINDCRLARRVLCETGEIDAQLAELQSEIEVVTELSRKVIYENARSAVNQTEWSERNNNYLERHRKALARLDELEARKRERIAEKEKTHETIKSIMLQRIKEPERAAVYDEMLVDFERREQLLDEQILMIKKEMEDAEGEKQKLNSALEIMTSVLKERKLGNGQLIMIINRILVKDAGDKMVDIKLELKAKYAQHIHEPPETKQVQRADITALEAI